MTVLTTTAQNQIWAISIGFEAGTNAEILTFVCSVHFLRSSQWWCRHVAGDLLTNYEATLRLWSHFVRQDCSVLMVMLSCWTCHPVLCLILLLTAGNFGWWGGCWAMAGLQQCSQWEGVLLESPFSWFSTYICPNKLLRKYYWILLYKTGSGASRFLQKCPVGILLVCQFSYSCCCCHLVNYLYWYIGPLIAVVVPQALELIKSTSCLKWHPVTQAMGNIKYKNEDSIVAIDLK